MSRLARAIVALIILFVLGAVACVGALFVISGGQPVDYLQTAIVRYRLAGRQADLNRAVSPDDAPIRFTIAPGDSPHVIAQNLLADNLIFDADLFVDYVRANDLDVELEAGTYFPNRSMTIPRIAVMLTDSRASFIPFQIIEGMRIEEIAEELIDGNPYFGFTGDDFLRAVGPGVAQGSDFATFVGLPAGASLEGFLFPDSYQLPPEVTPEMLRDTLTEQFINEVGTTLRADAAAADMTLYEAVTLGSIVQREGVRRDEFPRIASVYRNRMDINMKLDADPTVQYALAEEGNWWPQITQADYTNTISPYNTYLNFGLPPGPIASPGIDAIEAAIHPETTPYLYFRARCDGSGYHAFAETFDEHVANGC